MSAVYVIGADVGGTHTKVGFARVEGGRATLVERHVYRSREHTGLELALRKFLARDAVAPHATSLGAACFAVAGPVEAGRAQLTNLPWQLEETTLAGALGIPVVRIINDFAAAGLGVEQLGEGDLRTLQAGTPRAHGQRLIVGAGTGLGVAVLDWDDDGYEVHPSEAGHMDFAPTDARQDALLSHLRQAFPRVSYERLVCGGGLVRIFCFLEERGEARVSAALRDAMTAGDPAQAIAEFALARRDELAIEALDLFASLYGAFAGNMALAALAHGGVYVAGGIAPKIAAKLGDGTFVRAFNAKGRFQALLETMPVKVVMNEHVGLYGALAEAARLASGARVTLTASSPA